jgi:tripartite-type tricarboxylate transporter receptor subunit TctC
VVQKLNAEVRAALASPEVKDRLSGLGADPSPTSPADFDKQIARELQENAVIVKQAGIKIQ